MKVILDDIVHNELIEFMLSQEGIIDVKRKEVDLYIEIEIKHNEKTTPSIIMKYIDLFLDSKFSSMISFEKENNKKVKKLKYTIKDICCEYCYKGLVRELFDKKEVISLKSNFDIYMPSNNIEIEIEYDENYNEDDLISYIKTNS